MLVYILKDRSIDQVLLFSRTKHGADKIARNLKKKNIKVAAIHGDKAQNQRVKVLESGTAISICESEENAYIKSIEKLIKKQIPIANDHPFPQTDRPMNEAEKKEWEKEKQKRKQEFFANRKKTEGRRWK